MGIRGLQPQTFQIPLAGGLQQGTHKFALEAPGLSTALNVQFDDVGALQPRRPYVDIGTNIFGGGDLADVRRIVENGDELLCFTKDTLYSWSPTRTAWVSKGTHLAIKANEATAFATTADQVDSDRAELAGTVVYTWTDAAGAYCAAIDGSSGAVVMAPTSFGAPTSRPRLIALTTKILLLFYDGVNGLYAYALDPANPAAALAGASTTVTNVAFGTYYDAVRVAATDTAAFVAAGAPTTSYVVGTITEALVVVKTTKGRTCDGAIAISVDPTGTSGQVVRGNGTNVQGDLITLATLVDVYTAQAIGTAAATPIVQIAAAHRSVQDSAVYRCYAFWSGAADTAGVPTWGTKYNWVSTGNTLGVQALFGASVYDEQCGLASRAFDYNGRVYVWLVFSGTSANGTSPTRIALENTYFMFRDDVFLCAKVSPATAGGAPSSTSRLPGVALVSGSTSFAWCGTRRRIVALGGSSGGYGARTPQDITFSFDSDEARRTARIGSTLYITGGEILQYDGLRLVEVGFHVFPFYLVVTPDPGAGSVADGTYSYKSTYRWDNAVGEADRSTTATYATVVMAGGPGHFDVVLLPITATHKHIANCSPAKEVWRTPVNPNDDTPLYLVTSRDPAAADPNGYVTIDQFTMADHLSDASLRAREEDPETGGVLESLAPPAASIILASESRIFLAGIADNLHQVRYSKLRAEGSVASFHDGLAVPVPKEGGVITGLGFLNEIPVAFKETAIFALDGKGLNNVGLDQNYEPRRVPSDVGAINHESIAVTPGGLVFKSKKGWYLLTQGWTVQYIGAAVKDYDDETVRSVHVVESQHQVRCLTSSRMLVWDYLANEWAEWSIAAGVHAAMWSGTYHYATAAGVFAERSDYTAIDYGIDVETAWIPLLGQVQGFGRVWKLMLLGEYRGAHTLRVRVGRDRSSAYFQDKTWTPSPTTVGGPLQLAHEPSIQEMSAIRLRITAGPVTVGEASTYSEALKLVSLALELGVEQGLNRLPAAQRQ